MANLLDINKEIRRAVDTGKVLFGTEQVKKNLLRGKAQIVIAVNNMPSIEKEEMQSLAEIAGIGFYNYEGNGLELGSVCGKPFGILSMAILDEGKSKLIESLKEPKKEAVKKIAKKKGR